MQEDRCSNSDMHVEGQQTMLLLKLGALHLQNIFCSLPMAIIWNCILIQFFKAAYYKISPEIFLQFPSEHLQVGRGIIVKVDWRDIFM